MAITMKLIKVNVSTAGTVDITPADLNVTNGEYYQWQFDKLAVASARIDFPLSSLYTAGAHWGVSPTNCELVPMLPEIVLHTVAKGTYPYNIVVARPGCLAPLGREGRITVG